MTDSNHFFTKVESLRRHMMLNVSQFCELLEVSRMSYYGWVRGKSIRKKNEDKVKKTIKNLLVIMKEHDWPSSSVIAMEPKERFEHLKELLAEI